MGNWEIKSIYFLNISVSNVDNLVKEPSIVPCHQFFTKIVNWMLFKLTINEEFNTMIDDGKFLVEIRVLWDKYLKLIKKFLLFFNWIEGLLKFQNLCKYQFFETGKHIVKLFVVPLFLITFSHFSLNNTIVKNNRILPNNGHFFVIKNWKKYFWAK